MTVVRRVGNEDIVVKLDKNELYSAFMEYCLDECRETIRQIIDEYRHSDTYLYSQIEDMAVEAFDALYGSDRNSERECEYITEIISNHLRG